MKTIFTSFFMLLTTFGLLAHGGGNYEHSDFFGSMQTGDKAAILMVHFGTTHDDTRALTIDVLNDRVRQQFPDLEVREAYTSRIVIKRLGDRGITKSDPLEVLQQLKSEGYTHILIQSSTIIDGKEMESLERNAAEVKDQFKEVRVGNPLLYDPDDYEAVIAAITKGADKNLAYVLVGHGTYDSTTAQYAMLDYMLKAKGHQNFFVGTIEGYPEYDDMLAQLQQSGLKKVVLVPFMFVAGEHAKNDIEGDWKEELEKAGYTVEVKMQGLGENVEIQDIFINHLKFKTRHRKLDIMEKKAKYRQTGEKED